MRTISQQTVGRTDGALIWSSRIVGLTRVLGGILFLALFDNSIQANQSVALAWSQSADTSVAGYKSYYGVVSRTYSNMVNPGNATSVTIPGLVEGTTYFFAVTAYNASGLESDYSNEISYTIPSNFASLQIRAAPAGQVVLTVTGQVGRTYNIQASPDTITWNVISTVIVPASGSLDFIDTKAASYPNRFYRTQ